MDVNNNSGSMKLRIKCDLCEIGKFLSKEMHFCHLKVVRPQEKKSWEIKLQPSENDNVKCLDCQQTFSTMDSAQIHYKTQHFAVKTNKNCKCQVCAKFFENNRKLSRHIHKKHNFNGWMTKDVGQQTKKPSTTEKRWKKKLSPIDNGFVKCLDCSKEYSSMYSAMKHFKEVHLKLISFKCLYCEKSFTQKCNLKRHVINIHKEMNNYL